MHHVEAARTAALFSQPFTPMKAGMFLRKVKSRMWKRLRHYKLQEDCKTIAYKSNGLKMTDLFKKIYTDFSISDVEAVREGHQSEALLNVADDFPADRCFTLVFRGRRGNLDLVADSAKEAQAWIQGIRVLMENMENMDESTKLDQWISDWFLKADLNKDGRINFKEAKKLLKMMNVDMNEEHMADKSESGTLEDQEFVEFYKMLTERTEVLDLFQDYSSDGQSLSQCDLEEFLREEQLEGEGSYEHALQLIDCYEPSDTARKNHSMSVDGFLMYLTSPEGSIFNPERQGLFQDMSQPLAHYYISSSHNTYLMEDQLKGPSSVEAYIQALKRGCRCVEVDCWNGSNGEPVVYHGHTLTSKILLKDVIATIANYAFKASEYPLIVSIENHCSIEQQEVMARYFRDILGDMLLTNTVEGVSSKLPSPEALKRKILLKGKKIGNESESPTGEVSDEDEAAEMNKDSPKSKQNLCKELSDLMFCKSIHFHSFEHSRMSAKPNEMSSFSESKARSDFVLHNTRQLTRVYPSGMRTDSSNYCPVDMWNMGCQIVALNFQTAGMEMDLNDGLFTQNGCSGYILKSEILRKKERFFDPENPEEREDYHPLLFSVKVISGQQLPKVKQKDWSIVDPLVRVEMYGVPLDQVKQETKYIDNNGFNPHWNETLQFTIHTPELALVRFVVEDYDKASRNDFIGQYTLPFTCIQPGYRHVHLLSKDGTSIHPSSIYVHIKITEL
uniref:Phosphoinositide phospholipase C n=1 Tax=Sinocyclocheilus anshuiensis TaxID=1608454 RepID=A0A671KSQ3_9TELE